MGFSDEDCNDGRSESALVVNDGRSEFALVVIDTRIEVAPYHV